jgi:2-iminobutanoate/2-iminopropanoate deaminase
VKGGIEARTDRILRNLEGILKAAGSGLERVVKTTVFLTDMADFQAFNKAYGEHFKGAPPARSTVQVAALPKGSNIEIEAIAYLG